MSESAALSWYLTEKDRKKLDWQSRVDLASNFISAPIRKGQGTGTAADTRYVREREEHREEKDRTKFTSEIAKVRDFLAGKQP